MKLMKTKILPLFLALIFLFSVLAWPGIGQAQEEPTTPSSATSSEEQQSNPPFPPVSSSPLKAVVISEDEADFLNLFKEIQDLIANYHTKDVDQKALYEGAIRGVIEALRDPYSQYLTKEQVQQFSSEVEGSYIGIGVTIEIIDGNVTVVSAFKGSPADHAGVKPGDVIVSVDGKDLKGKALKEVSALLRGPEGTQVTLQILRSSNGGLFQVTLTRAKILIPTLELKDMGQGIKYIAISQFTPQTGREFPPILNYLKSTGLKGLILDLRNNPGGTLDSCLEIANVLVPKGPVVELRRKELKEVIENPLDTKPVPVVVLVNNGTASASEILAGAIRDRGVGILVGEHTFGKACVQALIPLGKDLGSIKLTIADYYTPSGFSLAGSGLQPDIVVTPRQIKLPMGITYERAMKPGQIGLDVLALQENLSFLGYDVGERDGVFGPKTLEALKAFCRDNKIDGSSQVTKDVADAIGKKVIFKVKSVEDPVIEKAMEVISRKITRGTW